MSARPRGAALGGASADPGPGVAGRARPGLLVLALSLGVTTLATLSLVVPVLRGTAGEWSPVSGLR